MTAPPAKYSVELPNSRKPGQTGIYRNALRPDSLIVTYRPDVKTLYENFQYALKISGDRPLLGHKPFNKATRKFEPYSWQTYKQVAERVTNFGSGLMHLNDNVIKNPNSKQWAVGIYSNNRPEWFITDGANQSYNLITVALYDTLGAESIEYVANHAEIKIIVVGANHIPNLIQIAHKIPGVKVCVSMDRLDDEEEYTSLGLNMTGKILRSWAQEKGILLLDFNEVERIGQQHPRKHNPPSPNDIASICYTSGTTGTPKGALLSHASFIGSLSAVYHTSSLRQDDIFISYLPLAHVFGRIGELSVISYGASIGYYSGDILNLIDDMAELKPTLFATVPRLLTRVYAKIQQSTVNAPGVKGALSRRAFAAKLERLDKGLGNTHPFWDRILFNKIKQVLGGRVRRMVTGSAPIASEILQFLRVAFSCDISEGYGQTEGIASATISLEGENRAGHVGGPVICCEVKLVDVPEMRYFSTDKPFPRGELCIRGTNVFSGYYKNEAKTKETIDDEGWLHTGDVAYIDERGAVTIIDRKKNIFKLSQGEYIAPEKIENVYASSGLILQIFVHGDSIRDHLVAIAIPNPEVFVPWANTLTGQNVSLSDEKGLESLVKNDLVRNAFLEEINKIGKEAKLKSFELVKSIHLTHVPLTVEDGLLTPTLKIKRNEAQNYFRDVIDKLYGGRDNVKAKL
ncbi:6680_t:CDS:10 [Acaulospora morrowiae]|uniref:Long-chain-fatty-acid--CoA ligase n=1 Tax=Acaulospora morrowiae TaxID=94023 RepID=A0A9N9GY74_9GLOM|nr:6680_t:CDS:10 [Acaulospora morrowiae]